jgi:choice-of-anchor B domain-containing protein
MRKRAPFVVLLGLATALVLMAPGYASKQADKRSPAVVQQAGMMKAAAKGGKGKSKKPQTMKRCVRGTAGPYACKNIDMLSQVSMAELGLSFVNDTWGWIDPQTKREYALVGGVEGTVFVDITDKKRPKVLGILPAHTLDPQFPWWRDIKVYADHAYVVSEQDGHGMQVFDLTQLRNDPPGYTTYSETAHYDEISWSHNLAINEDTGFAYPIGSGTCAGGLHMVDITTPDNPTFAGCFDQHGYIHDTQCVVYNGPDSDWTGREICFNSNAEVHHNPPPGSDPITNALSIVDVTDKANPVVISRTEYDGDGYSHQGWLTPNQAYFLHGDELDELEHGNNTITRVWDVRDLDAPVMTLAWENPKTAAIDHNMYTKGKYVYQSNYSAGLRVLDISRVSVPALREVAFFDVSPEDDLPHFDRGTWSNYPYWKNKHIVTVSSMDRGLFVLKTRALGSKGKK